MVEKLSIPSKAKVVVLQGVRVWAFLKKFNYVFRENLEEAVILFLLYIENLVFEFKKCRYIAEGCT